MTARSHVQVLENHTDRLTGTLRAFQEREPGSQHFELGAQSFPSEVGGYFSALCYLRGALEAMTREVATLRTRDEASRRTIKEFHEQMRSAAAIQRDLLPTHLPDVAGLDLYTLFRPVEALSGDLYDVFRIDDTHVGFTLADATGHGLPGGVLATFVSRSVHSGRIQEGVHQSLQPNEVLQRINRDLLDAGLSDCPFVTALYAVYHEPTRTLTWARAGAPYPILVRRGETPRQIMSQGPLTGAVADAEFETVSLALDPGDTVVFHTDGLEAVTCEQPMQRSSREFSDSNWFRQFGKRSFERQIENLEARLDSIDESDWRRDDVTLMALHARQD